MLLAPDDFNANVNPGNADIVINESMAKMMGKESAIGMIIQSPRGNPEGVYTNLIKTAMANPVKALRTE